MKHIELSQQLICRKAGGWESSKADAWGRCTIIAPIDVHSSYSHLKTADPDSRVKRLNAHTSNVQRDQLSVSISASVITVWLMICSRAADL